MSPPSTYRGRFAPSPTGPLHLGSLLAAVGSWLLARQAGGQWWLRIEDVDGPRTVAGAAQQQMDTLAAFGLAPDGPVVWQSQRGERYAQVLQSLVNRDLAFACHCSRTELAATGGIHHACVARRERAHPAWRLRVAPGAVIGFHDGLQGQYQQDVHAQVGDVVLRRADGQWAYQLAVVVDDADQGMTDIVRGADLLDSTPRQILLQHALGWSTPRYLHLPLLIGADGQKLSKSLAAAPVDGADPKPALRLVWEALGQDPRRLPWQAPLASLMSAAVPAFDPARIPKQGRLPVSALHNKTDSTAV
ncbi:tRNA glutamyl-Q(34) synthetase GluQRS [Pseudoxanthomonas indica]|uniref:Glutamyl-Q tRNA(Asp) synthetase n=1 Tax=Pseudoxanthomonas indica TaxID=428993 RepID=A0A1T5LVL0_9GAMM|nr:tRNA glutamyl-Q(34) synthetase GluQRS [Pseudoxanthomonas indica]SKC79982.1 glutamyl-Q tRNA(Asp) synthetase [Pseudoxanthomonas indica]